MNSLEILNAHGLRRTGSRTSILEIFMRSDIALSENDIEANIHGMCDRATIYRTLKTFLENDILHKVLDENNIVKYAMCNHDHCTDHVHNHEHVHFKCDKCGHTICMDQIPIQHVKLPDGYTMQEANFLVIGTCNKCNA
ncbi:transcriptional repressor [Limibacter armeniacum]|uniref:Fur family transcriptional regulator n=1 Tax=Limibacter armeniacum TaxID=466084 RepID=UPI002FE66CBC